MLTGVHNVRILIIEASLVHFAIVDIKSGGDLLHSSLVARFDVERLHTD